MRLIHDEVTFSTGAQAICLRPSLRAGMRLHRDWGVDHLFGGVSEGSLSVMVAIIEATAERADMVQCQLEDMVRRGGVAALAALKGKLLDILAACFGLPGDDAATETAATEEGDRIASFDDFFERLFEIGTGWLEWSPAETYAASPAEILIAQRGKLKLLRAIHGAGDEDDKPAADARKEVPLETVREGLAKLRDLSAPVLR